MAEKLIKHREIWNKKKILRTIYNRWYQSILRDLKVSDSKTIELGAGSGNFKNFKPDVLSSDIEPCPWLDLSFDAHRIPFKTNSAGNMVMIDVLHHLADPILFFNEAERVLNRGGRIVIIEPFPTIFSLYVYKRFHPEPFLFDKNLFHRSPDAEMLPQKKDPWQSNQAVAYLLFFKFRKQFMALFGGKFKLVKTRRMSVILYPASGGFENKALIPDFLIPFFKLLEIILLPFRRWLAFRCYIVLEKV